MKIEEKVALYNAIQDQRRVLKHSGQPRDEQLDKQSVELMLDIERTHSLTLCN